MRIQYVNRENACDLNFNLIKANDKEAALNIIPDFSLHLAKKRSWYSKAYFLDLRVG